MNQRTTVAALAFSMLTPSVLHAEPHSLEWSAPEACPTREAFERAVRERVGSEAFAANARRTLNIELSGAAGAWRAALRVNEAETTHGAQTLDSAGADCSALFSAVVAVASVMVGSEAPRPAPEDVTLAAAPPATAPLPARKPEPSPLPPPAPPPAQFDPIFFGVELAQDLPIHSGGDACRPDSDRFDCYFSGTETRFGGTPSDDTGRTDAGLVPGAQRLLATLVWEITPDLTLDVRAGAAFGNVGPDFLPWHLEAGVRHFLAGPESTLRGFVGASVGYARVDVKLETSVRECDAAGANCGGHPVSLDAVDPLGPGFAAAELGLRWRFAGSHAFEGALAANVAFPDTGVVLRPSLAYLIGF